MDGEGSEKRMNVKVCFLCCQYTPIHPENSLSQAFVSEFEGMHNKHPVQTINRNEVPKNFICITDKKREESLESLDPEWLNLLRAKK